MLRGVSDCYTSLYCPSTSHALTNRNARTTAYASESAQGGLGIAAAVLADVLLHFSRVGTAADGLQGGGI